MLPVQDSETAPAIDLVLFILAPKTDNEQRAAFEREKRALEAGLKEQSAALAAARERNERMYKLGFELIERSKRKSSWTSLLEAEPFTGLKRAQIEKMAEEEREKFDAARLPHAN